MSKNTMVILVVLVVLGLGIWGFFWQKGKAAEEELKRRAEALKTEQVAPAPTQPAEATPSEATPAEEPAQPSEAPSEGGN